MSELDVKRDRARLQAMLDAHGANPARWPVGDALRLAEFARADVAGRAMLAEAAALDELLSAAPHGLATQGLADRIVGQVAGSARGTAEIVGLPARKRGASGPGARREVALWPVCGALAAALAIGFFAGNAGLVAPALKQVAGISFEEADLTPADSAQEGDVL